MNSSSCFITRIRFSVAILVLSTLLLSQHSKPVQSLSLSRLCGQFGHSCFGGNWGRRDVSDALSQEYDLLNSNTNDNDDDDQSTTEPVMDPNSMSDYVLGEFRLELLRQRLRQLLRLE